MTVAEELLWESQPEEIRRIADGKVAEMLLESTDRAWQDGYAHGHGDGRNEGFNLGVQEGLRRATVQKEKPA